MLERAKDNGFLDKAAEESAKAAEESARAAEAAKSLRD